MKLTLSWLKSHLETDKDVKELTDKLTAIGLELEELTNPAEALKDFIIAEIKDVKDHPDSDHLHILAVDTGKETLQIVCGAPNVRVGLKGVLARPGCVIPVNGETLKVGKIRGIESFGMMCSGRELGLSEDHNGILDLDTKAANGTSFAEVLGSDPVIDLNVLANRPDCFGVIGVARDLAAAGMGKFKSEPIPEIKGKFKSPIDVKLSPSGCKIFSGMYIRGVKNGQSPKWMQERLTAVGLRPISALVDVTNYLNIDRCRPLHVFDADKLKGNINVRYATEGEKITTLDEKEHTLAADMTVISDDSGALSVAGIMGGINTGVSENTTNVFLESAWFEPLNIAKTGRALGIESDSRTRFERGVDAASSTPDLMIAAKMIIDICGGEPSEPVIAGENPAWQRDITFSPACVKRLCGVDVAKDECEKILTDLGFKVEGDKVAPPSWRPDIEGEPDIVEEIMRIYGYDKLPALSCISGSMPKVLSTPSQRKSAAAKRAMANRGGNQIISWSFMDSKIAKDFGSREVLLENPIASNLDELRPSLVPNLIAAAQRNADRGYPNVSLFEVGPVFLGRKPNEQAEVAAMLRAGLTHAKSWIDTPRDWDAFDAKADALATLAAAGAPIANLQVYRTAPGYYHPSRSGALCLGKDVLAYFGEVHPAILGKMGLEGRAVAAEVFLDKVPNKVLKTKTQKKLTLSPFQPVHRDFAFIADKELEAGKLVRAVKGVDKDLISTVNVFDVYEGKNLEGKKSIALEVVIEPMEKTLTDAELDNLSQRIIKAATAEGATLRS